MAASSRAIRWSRSDWSLLELSSDSAVSGGDAGNNAGRYCILLGPKPSKSASVGGGYSSSSAPSNFLTDPWGSDGDGLSVKPDSTYSSVSNMRSFRCRVGVDILIVCAESDVSIESGQFILLGSVVEGGAERSCN